MSAGFSRWSRRSLLVDGGDADCGAAALPVKVTELLGVATALADEAFEEARRKCYLLGSDIAEWALPGYDVKGDLH